MRRLGLVLILLSAGCASAPIKKQDVPSVARADARVLDGCYDCLREARAIYERVAVGKARPVLMARLFETQLLIALREKELAIDSAASMSRVRDLAKEMPPIAEASRYLALVDAVLPDGAGIPRRQMRQLRSDQTSLVPNIDGELAWLRASVALREPVRQYLSMSVDCAFLRRPTRLAGSPPPAADLWTGTIKARELPPETVPLVAYRAATCEAISRPMLERLRQAVPDFVETSFFVARLEVLATVGELANGPSGMRRVDVEAASPRKAAGVLLAEVVPHFPGSPAVTYLAGSYSQIVGDCRAALARYDETLVLAPVHEDALLGRVACLSFLRRPDEAIAAATHMIELQTDNWGDAYYWRAWNHHSRQALAPARADVDRAKALSPSEQAFTLAGIIEHDQNALDVAEPDLRRAKAMNRNGRNCTAMWYLALVKLKQEKWIDSAGHFGDAMGCYAANVADEEEGMRAMAARTDLDADFKAHQIANFEIALKEDRSQQYAAAFNAANQSARGGDLEKAKTLLAIAAKDPALAEHVAELREILK